MCDLKGNEIRKLHVHNVQGTGARHCNVAPLACADRCARTSRRAAARRAGNSARRRSLSARSTWPRRARAWPAWWRRWRPLPIHGPAAQGRHRRPPGAGLTHHDKDWETQLTLPVWVQCPVEMSMLCVWRPATQTGQSISDLMRCLRARQCIDAVLARVDSMVALVQGLDYSPLERANAGRWASVRAQFNATMRRSRPRRVTSSTPASGAHSTNVLHGSRLRLV